MDKLDLRKAIETEDGRKKAIEFIDRRIKEDKPKGELLKWAKKLRDLIANGAEETRLYIFFEFGA